MLNNNKANAIYKMAIKKKQIIAVLEIKKMIPVHEDCYTEINIKQLQLDYQLLLNEEYLFCKRYKQDIVMRVEKLYSKNKMKQSRPMPYACDYCKLEKYTYHFNNKHQR